MGMGSHSWIKQVKVSILLVNLCSCSDLHSSGMWDCVTGLLVTKFWDDMVVFFILTLEDETFTSYQNVRNQLPSDTVPHPRRMLISTVLLWRCKSLHVFILCNFEASTKHVWWILLLTTEMCSARCIYYDTIINGNRYSPSVAVLHLAAV